MQFQCTINWMTTAVCVTGVFEQQHQQLAGMPCAEMAAAGDQQVAAAAGVHLKECDHRRDD